MRFFIVFFLCSVAASGAQAPLPESQVAQSDERMSGIIAQQALINARLGVEIDQLRQVNRKLEADLARAKQELEAERKAHVKATE